MHDSLQKITTGPIKILAQEEADLGFLFGQQFFGAVDSNIAAWLPSSLPFTPATEVSAFELKEPLNNQELIDAIGGLELIFSDHLFSPTQIVDLVARSAAGEDILQKNGFQNLFFVFNTETEQAYLVGVVYDESISKWVPYIYRLRNQYRAWSRGNRLFLRTNSV